MTEQSKKQALSETPAQRSLTDHKLYTQLCPMMRYLYFQKSAARNRQDGTVRPLLQDLKQGWNLARFMLTYSFPSPISAHQHLKKRYCPTRGAVEMAADALQVGDEMIARSCYLYDQKNRLKEVSFSHPLFVPGRVKMEPWIRLLERPDLRRADCKASYMKWAQQTESGRRYETRRQVYVYALNCLKHEMGISPVMVCNRKWYPQPPTPTREHT